MADKFVTSTITGASFTDGATLSGKWTAEYSPSGVLVAVSHATFTVSGPGGTTIFTDAGTLPYADSTESTSYEIRFGGVSGGDYGSLYVDWRGETPESFYLGSPSLYTSVTDDRVGTKPIRLADGGAPAAIAVPVICGLPDNARGVDLASMTPFGRVTVTDTRHHAADSATIVLSDDCEATDANGRLSGAGLTRVGVGTYRLVATDQEDLSEELRALRFTPTQHQVAAGRTVETIFSLTVTDRARSTTANMTLTETATCFLAGTRLMTEHGEIAVEHLAAGDSIATLQDGAIVHRPIIWVGARHLDAAAVLRTGIRPVRIRAGAFSDCVPHRDLLVTPDHCILVDGCLVPARMLVNAHSIIEDHSIASFSYHHVELETHAVLIAEGLTTESYLDTGNRDCFATDPVAALRPELAVNPAHKSWARHACALLAIDRETVEPIWRRLRARASHPDAGETGCDDARSRDPRLRVLLDDGGIVAARWDGEGRHFFQIPAGGRPVRLLSRVAVPARSIGPFVDDRRSLGVQVRSLVFWRGLDDCHLAATGIALQGWHEAEGGARWTDGAASLDLPRAGASDTFLEVHVVGGMRYADDGPALLAA